MVEIPKTVLLTYTLKTDRYVVLDDEAFPYPLHIMPTDTVSWQLEANITPQIRHALEKGMVSTGEVAPTRKILIAFRLFGRHFEFTVGTNYPN